MNQKINTHERACLTALARAYIKGIPDTRRAGYSVPTQPGEGLARYSMMPVPDPATVAPILERYRRVMRWGQPSRVLPVERPEVILNHGWYTDPRTGRRERHAPVTPYRIEWDYLWPRPASEDTPWRLNRDRPSY